MMIILYGSSTYSSAESINVSYTLCQRTNGLADNCSKVDTVYEIDLAKGTVRNQGYTLQIGEWKTYANEASLSRSKFTFDGSKLLLEGIVTAKDYRSEDTFAINFDPGSGRCIGVKWSGKTRYTHPSPNYHPNWTTYSKAERCSGKLRIAETDGRPGKTSNDRADPRDDNQCLAPTEIPHKNYKEYAIKLTNRCKKTIRILYNSCGPFNPKLDKGQPKCTWQDGEYVESLSTRVIKSWVRYPEWKLR